MLKKLIFRFWNIVHCKKLIFRLQFLRGWVYTPILFKYQINNALIKAGLKIFLKWVISLLIISLFTTDIYSQSYSINVHNGHGSGSYLVGDTAHIWSVSFDSTETFREWTGDISFLDNPKEWHTKIVMPSQNLNVTAVIDILPAHYITHEQIMGANNLKNVYSCLPDGLKGVLFLFHGTGGNASNWFDVTEYRSFVNAAIADSFGIIVTEAEEITLNSDLNGDGKLRWQGLPIDTVNGIDYQNIKILTDTFIDRGNFTNSTPIFSVGMSNGGSFSAAISYAFNYKAGISYCASSIQGIFTARPNPFAFRMANLDDNEEVGAEGNYEAWQYDSIMESRNICHDYIVNDKQPLYPERFARITGISMMTSHAIFTELIMNDQLNEDHYALHSDSIMKNVMAHPAQYPHIMNLTGSLRKEVLNQIATSNSEHSFYSDFNYETLSFLDKLCSPTGVLNDLNAKGSTLRIYPNPAFTEISLILPDGVFNIFLYNMIGQQVIHLSDLSGDSSIDLTKLNKGLYILQAVNENKSLITTFLKQ